MNDKTIGAEAAFRQSTMNRVASSEELNHYIKVTNPSAWVVVLAALLLVSGVLIWALAATVPITFETTGIVPHKDNPADEVVICFLDKSTAERLQKPDAKAYIGGVEAKSVEIGELPLSASEVINALGSDFYADSIELGNWNYMITIKPAAQLNHTDFTVDFVDGASNLVPVSIVVAETRPINIVFGNKDRNSL